MKDRRGQIFVMKDDDGSGVFLVIDSDGDIEADWKVINGTKEPWHALYGTYDIGDIDIGVYTESELQSFFTRLDGDGT